MRAGRVVLTRNLLHERPSKNHLGRFVKKTDMLPWNLVTRTTEEASSFSPKQQPSLHTLPKLLRPSSPNHPPRIHARSRRVLCLHTSNDGTLAHNHAHLRCLHRRVRASLRGTASSRVARRVLGAPPRRARPPASACSRQSSPAASASRHSCTPRTTTPPASPPPAHPPLLPPRRTTSSSRAATPSALSASSRSRQSSPARSSPPTAPRSKLASTARATCSPRALRRTSRSAPGCF